MLKEPEHSLVAGVKHVVLVAEMCVERRPANIRAIQNALNRDVLKFLLEHQLDQSRSQGVCATRGPRVGRHDFPDI